MPLIRFEVRNEYGLGAKELYTEANKDDPKAILEGVAVAGLVGILRQLGDLAEFAADVFHDLQEQVMATASRSRKMMARAQHIEAALPPLEKTILAQKSHIHFAYTAGSDWHPHIQTEQNHFIHSDLPRFIMDSFEECRDPPRLHLLDKFDTGGPGACLRRYSDPSFFKKELTSLESVSVEKVQREKKASKKSKKKGSRRRNGEVSHAVSMSRHSGRMPFSSPNVNGRIPTAETISTIHVRSKSELGDRSTSFDSRASSGYIECVFDASSSVLYRDQEPNDFSTSRLKMQNNGSITPDEQTRGSFDTLTPRSLEEHVPNTPSVTWEEKTEIVKPKSQQSDNVAEDVGEATELLPESFDLGKLESEDPPLRNIDPEDIICVNENIQELLSEGNRYDEVGSEPDSYMDALNTLESESETDSECQTKREVELASAKFKHREIECGPDVMNEMTSQNSESPNVENRTASYSSSIRQMSENVFDMASSEDLVDAPPPQITSTPSNPDVSVDTDLCESTDLLDDSGVNVCESATNGLSYSDLCESTDLLDDSGVNVCESATNGLSYSDSTLPDSESPLSDKIVSMSESHPVNISTNGSLCESQECSMDGPSSLGSNIPNSGAPLDDKIASSLCESQESPVEVSGPPSIAVWTNGGLLGLEPSKPPDFNVLNVANHKLVAGTNDDTHDLSNDTKLDMVEKNPSSGGGRERSPDIIGQNGLPQNQLIRRTGDMAQKIDHIECSTSYHDKQDDGMLQKQSVELLTAGSERLEKSEDLRHNSSSSNVHGQGLTEAIPDAKGPFSEASQENMESTSSLFGLSQRLLINGFRRKGSLVHDNTSELRESVKTGLFMLHEHEQKGKNKVAHQGKNKVVHQISTELNPKEQLENGSPVNSLSSSPPLEHMKISFHPINGYETAKLKLKFPGGNHFHESIKDVMFPSFQLLPEPAISLQDIDSDSDDDTFCRSSPYMSDEHMSQQSESSSEQWESGEIAGSKDHEMYDALRRVSSAESILSTFELEGIGHDSIHCNDDFKSLNTENGLEPFHYNPLTIQQERKCDSDPKDHIDSVSQCPNEPLQSLPPLPPVQWREMKSYFDIAETEQGVMSQALNQPDNLNILGATTPSQQPKPAPPKQPHMKEATSYLPKSKDQQLGENREANKTANFKEKDEREDLLHQIRTKSFNLKRTVPARTTVTPVPTTNVKVAAILEKANAIRQAFVGSDEEGNSETWSDG